MRKITDGYHCDKCHCGNVTEFWVPEKNDCASSSPLPPFRKPEVWLATNPKPTKHKGRLELCDSCRAHYELNWLMAAHLSGKLLLAVNYTWVNDQIKSVYLALMAKGA